MPSCHLKGMKHYSLRQIDSRQPPEWLLVVTDENAPGQPGPVPGYGHFTDRAAADEVVRKLNEQAP